MSQSPSKLRSRTFHALAIAAITFAIVVFLEGLTSATIFLYELAADPGGRRHPEAKRATLHDETLGWVNAPSVHIADMYGPGRYLRTNARGFRNDHEIETEVPEGKERVICSGDSFTFGQGVANDDTWCHLLSEMNDRYETVNMGQPGYGVDQAFLWYMRDGSVVDHDLHLFCFIGDNFSRMQRRAQHGYPKPVLRLDGGELVTDNVPVPRVRFRGSWTSRLGRAAADLRLVSFASRLGRRLSPPPSDEETQAVASRMFEVLREVNEEKSSLLVLVYLPVKSDIYRGPQKWNRWVRGEARRLDVSFVDVAEALRRIPSEEAETFFIPEGSPHYLDGGGHYTEAGNAWVAEAIHEALQEMAASGATPPAASN